MNFSRNLKRFEKFFSYVSVLCQVVGAVFILLGAGHYLLGGAELGHNFFSTEEISKVGARYKSPVYDGVNDGYAGSYSPAIPRDPHNLRLRDRVEKPIVLDMISRSNYKELFELLAGKRQFAAWDEKIAPSIHEHSMSVVDIFEAHLKQVKALAKGYGFEAYLFWQPNLFSLTRSHLTS